MNIRTFLILANFLQLIPRLFIRLDWHILCALLPIGQQNCLQCFNPGGRPSIRPVKTTWFVADVVICLEWGADDLNMVQSSWCHYEAITACFIKISEWFIFLLPVWPIVCHVTLSVVGRTDDPCKNGWTDQDAVCVYPKNCVIQNHVLHDGPY